MADSKVSHFTVDVQVWNLDSSIYPAESRWHLADDKIDGACYGSLPRV